MLARKLFNLAIVFNSGFVLLAFCGLNCGFFAVSTGLFLLFFIGVFAGKFSFKLFFASVGAFCFGAFCFFLQDYFLRQRALQVDGVSATVLARVVEVNKNSNGLGNYTLQIKHIDEKKLLFPIYANIYGKRGVDLLYGDELIANMSFAAKKTDNYGFVFSSSRSKNIHLNAKISKLTKIRAGQGWLVDFFNARNCLIDAVDFAVEEPANFLVSSIFLGGSSRLPYEIRRAFDCCGLSHIFAVSGLHISILFASLLFCLRFLKAPKWFMFLVLVLFLFFYNLLLGFCVSAIRASLMNLAYFIGTMANKRLNSIYTLNFTATTIFILMPGAVFSCSFVLSFSSCLGILIFFKRISTAIRRRLLIFSNWATFIIDLFSINLASMVFSSIFVALFFGKISLVAPVINLIVVPFVPFIFTFSGIVAVSGALGLLEISSFFGYFCEGIFLELVALVQFFAKLPFSFVPVRQFHVILIIFGLAFFLLFVAIYARNLLFSKVVAMFCCLIVFVPLLNNFVLASDSSSISMIGNKTGFSTIINRSGKIIVLNCGGANSEKRLCNFLDGNGIKKIDFLIFLSNNVGDMDCDLKTILNCVDTFCVMAPHSASFDHLARNFNGRGTHFVFVEQARFVNFPFSIEFLSSKKKPGFNCYISLGGLDFSYCLSKQDFEQMQKLRFSNLTIVDDEFESYDENWNCGFLISTKQSVGVDSKQFQSVLPNKITNFLIFGSFIKKMSL